MFVRKMIPRWKGSMPKTTPSGVMSGTTTTIFLALDLNGDGRINNGSELFGALSGNGFADLAQYDSDANGWIDENDEIFQRLKVWSGADDGGG